VYEKYISFYDVRRGLLAEVAPLLPLEDLKFCPTPSN
jgi:hypothetical protein